MKYEERKVKTEYENRFVLFLDILGFRSIIDDTVKVSDEKDKIKNLYEALESIRATLQSSLRFDINNGLTINIDNVSESTFNNHVSSVVVTQFSDSVIVSFLVDEPKMINKLLEVIQELLIDLVSKGIVCRGAIAKGKLVHDDYVVFGPALNEAYETESKAALYPRIILDKTILTIDRKIKSERNKIVRRDTDNKYYIDYFPDDLYKFIPRRNIQNYISNLQTIIKNGSGNTRKPDIVVKYGWMKNKFNRMIKSLKEEKNINPFSKETGLQDFIDKIKTMN